MKLKKILALVLCFAMVLSTMSFTVSAENEVSSASTYVANVDGTDYETLEAALKAITSGSTVTLLSDILVKGDDSGNWDERYTGGKISVPVTIDGNGKTIKINATVNDNNYDAFFRLEADATVKNLTMDFSESTDTRIRAISHKAGNLTVENCTFIGRGSTDNSRAIIFGEGGGKDGVAATTVSISGVNFTGWKRGVTDNENAQDAKSVSVTGCTFTDASAYVSAYENVVFSGNTMDDGWVNVKSYSNSETLTIVAENNTLEEDNGANMNNIGGSTKAKIGDKYFASFKGAASAAVDGDTIILSDGEHSIKGVKFNSGVITVKAADNAIVTIDVPDSSSTSNDTEHQDHDANVVFEDVIFDFYPNGNYNGLQYNTVTYNNCTINGNMFLYALTSDVFNNCTFNQNDTNNYNVWTYGSRSVEFNGCTFNSEGKSVLVYNEGNNGTELAVENCKFIANTAVEGKAAIEIDASLLRSNQSYAIDVDEDTTASGFATGSKSGNSLWNVKNDNCGGDTTVIVNDTVAFVRFAGTKEDAVIAAVVDGKPYAVMADAIAAIGDNSVVIIKEGTYADKLSITEKNVTVKADGDAKFTTAPYLKGTNWYVEGVDFEYAGEGYNIINTSGTLKNCTFTAEKSTLRYCYGAKDQTLLIDGCTFTTGNPRSYWAVHFDDTSNSNIIIKNSVLNGHLALATAKSVNVTDTNITGGWSNTYSDVTYTNCNFDVTQWIYTGGSSVVANFNNCTSSDGSTIKDLLYNENSTVIVDGVVETKVAKVTDNEGTSYFKTFAEAVEGASENATIDLMGNSVELTQANVGKALKIVNGTIALPASLARAATTPAYWFVSDVVTFENVTLTGENYDTAGWGVFYLTKTGASVNFINSTVNLKNDVSSGGGFIKGDVAGVTASFNNTDVYLENTKRGFNNLASLTLSNDSDFVLKGTTAVGMENAINKVGVLTVNDTSSIEIDGCFEYGIKMNDDFLVNDQAKVVVRNSGIADIMVRPEVTDETNLIVSDDAIVIADIIAPEVIEDGNGKIIEKSENIYVQFKKVDINAEDKDTVEGSDRYEIILSGYKHNINRLTTADLTFKLDANPHTNAAMDYTIESRTGISLTPHDADGYMFNFDGVTSPDETGENIVIGYVTISGYGNYTFSVADDDEVKGIKNIVNATEVQDSIVDTFVIGGATNKGKLIINTNIDNDNDMVGIIGSPDKVDIAVPTRKLKITIDFPNSVNDNVKAYQDMKVEITGNIDGENKTVTYDLGKDDAYAMDNGSYVVTENKLVLNESYTVKVSGAGYRTARYTVRMTEDKELKFWNNVMDEAQFVEIGKDSSKVNVTFLAGDIVKDNKINIYDLSAVVSYFGTTNVKTAYSDYAKYDLNRDGVIDSKDVAYVLVSWGN